MINKQVENSIDVSKLLVLENSLVQAYALLRLVQEELNKAHLEGHTINYVSHPEFSYKLELLQNIIDMLSHSWYKK